MSLINDADELSSSVILETKATKQPPILFKSWQDQFHLIHHLTLYSNILMVLQGRKSTGKTTYIHSLIEHLPDDFICKPISSKELNTADSIGLCLRQFIPLSNPETENSDIELVNQIVNGQKHCLLIVDDAHFLSDEVITALLTCLQSQDQNVYFHCLLVGNLMLSSKLSEPPFVGCIESFAHIIDLPDIELEDAKAYLQYKFSSLGVMQVSMFSDAKLLELIEQSQGDLNQLAELAQSALSDVSQPKLQISSLTKFKASHYQKRGMATIAVVVSILVFSLVKTPSPTTQKIQRLVLPTSPQLLTQPQETPQLAEFSNRPTLAPTIDLTNKSNVKKKSTPNSVPLSMIPKYTLLSKKTVKDKVDRKEMEIASQKRKGEKYSPKSISRAKRVEDKITSRMIAKAPLSSPLPLKDLAFKKTSKPKINTSDRANHNGYIGQGYGIQLVASSNLSSLKRFARKHHIFQQARYYTQRAKGKRLYMLIVGDYDSKAQAEKAQLSLPATLKKKKVWLRSIKGLRQTQ